MQIAVDTLSGRAILCGGTLVAGDEGLDFNTTNVPGQYVIEVCSSSRSRRFILPQPARLVICWHVAGGGQCGEKQQVGHYDGTV